MTDQKTDKKDSEKKPRKQLPEEIFIDQLAELLIRQVELKTE